MMSQINGRTNPTGIFYQR